MTGGDRVADVLAAHGVKFLFTLCGGHISPILVAAKRRGIRVVDVRDEASAVFAADAVARLTGTAGVAAVTAGPGLTNAITAVKNAQLAQSPLVLFGGATATVWRAIDLETDSAVAVKLQDEALDGAGAGTMRGEELRPDVLRLLRAPLGELVVRGPPRRGGAVAQSRSGAGRRATDHGSAPAGTRW